MGKGAYRVYATSLDTGTTVSYPTASYSQPPQRTVQTLSGWTGPAWLKGNAFFYYPSETTTIPFYVKQTWDGPSGIASKGTFTYTAEMTTRGSSFTGRTLNSFRFEPTVSTKTETDPTYVVGPVYVSGYIRQEVEIGTPVDELPTFGFMSFGNRMSVFSLSPDGTLSKEDIVFQ
jgi:hypothetical protein